jgi:hypothetical protein
MRANAGALALACAIWRGNAAKSARLQPGSGFQRVEVFGHRSSVNARNEDGGAIRGGLSEPAPAAIVLTSWLFRPAVERPQNS